MIKMTLKQVSEVVNTGAIRLFNAWGWPLQKYWDNRHLAENLIKEKGAWDKGYRETGLRLGGKLETIRDDKGMPRGERFIFITDDGKAEDQQKYQAFEDELTKLGEIEISFSGVPVDIKDVRTNGAEPNFAQMCALEPLLVSSPGKEGRAP